MRSTESHSLRWSGIGEKKCCVVETLWDATRAPYTPVGGAPFCARGRRAIRSSLFSLRLRWGGDVLLPARFQSHSYRRFQRGSLLGRAFSGLLRPSLAGACARAPRREKMLSKERNWPPARARTSISRIGAGGVLSCPAATGVLSFGPPAPGAEDRALMPNQVRPEKDFPARYEEYTEAGRVSAGQCGRTDHMRSIAAAALRNHPA